MSKFNWSSWLVTFFLIFPGSSAVADVWRAENQWDSNWERRYQQWVKTQWTDDIFMNPAKPIYYKFENDCADASYAMRLIFAYEHKLPFVVNDQMRPGKTISNSM